MCIFCIVLNQLHNFQILLHDQKEIPPMIESAFLVTSGMIASVAITVENVSFTVYYGIQFNRLRNLYM